MKLTALPLALLLTSCASETADRVFTPTEELWVDAYCHGDLVYPGDQGRVARWAKAKEIVCDHK